MRHNPYFSGNLFAIEEAGCRICNGGRVTILILVETSLQSEKSKLLACQLKGHNPYFSGNLFAMEKALRFIML